MVASVQSQDPRKGIIHLTKQRFKKHALCFSRSLNKPLFRSCSEPDTLIGGFSLVTMTGLALQELPVLRSRAEARR